MSGPSPLRVAAWPAGRDHQSNPYSRLLADALRAEGCIVDDLRWPNLWKQRYDVVHAHWPEWVIASGSAKRITRTLASLAWARRRGARLVWTVHNLAHHEGGTGTLERRARRAFVAMVDGFISLTAGGVDAAREEFPGLARTPAFVIPHGHYRDVYPNWSDRAGARDLLGIDPDARVLAFVGQIRPYKQVVELVRAFRQVSDPGAVLLVAGRPLTEEYGATVHAAAAGDPRIVVRTELLPLGDMHLYLNAADLVVLPYRETLNSGVAILALSFDRPVLGPNKGAFADLGLQLGPQWVQTFDGDVTPAVLTNALARVIDGPPTAPADLSALEWDAIARATIDAYRAVGAGARTVRTMPA
jgi:glycosyltransferase involved in cell wall biosynthesis